MVGVVGSSPIEPTNESETSVCRGFANASCNERFGVNGEQSEYGYDTANVDRNCFGATLVEDHFRPCCLQ